MMASCPTLVVIDRDLGWYTVVTNVDNPVDYYDHRYRVWSLLVKLKIGFFDWSADEDRVDFSF